MSIATIIPVILCGGSGTRLWPLSRECAPKQFLSLFGDASFFQETARRALRVTGAQASEVVAVTLASMAQEARTQLALIDPDLTRHIIAEPEARNTAAAIALAALYVRRHFGDKSLMLVLPSDHHIADETNFKAALMAAVPVASSGMLVTFGIKPTRPETGYGYIRTGDTSPFTGVLRVKQFTEKPERDVARRYINSGNYLWNSGMFLFSAEAGIERFSTHIPETLGLVEKVFTGAPDFYKSVKRQSFDTAILEKADNVAVVPCDIEWTDIGSWRGLLNVFCILIKKRINALLKNRLSCLFAPFRPRSSS